MMQSFEHIEPGRKRFFKNFIDVVVLNSKTNEETVHFTYFIAFINDFFTIEVMTENSYSEEHEHFPTHFYHIRGFTVLESYSP